MTAVETDRDRFEEIEDRVRRDFPRSWIPSETDSVLVGEFMRLEEGMTARGPAWIAVLRTKDGTERSVWLLHEVLRQQLGRFRPAPGELVGIGYHGRKVSTGGREYEQYRVAVDREHSDTHWDFVLKDPGSGVGQWTETGNGTAADQDDIPF